MSCLMLMKVAIIPAYNEEDSIAKVVKGTLKHVDKVLVMDDGSTDNTATRAIVSSKVAVMSCTVNRGLGIIMRDGYKIALKMGADIIVQIDADGQYLPKEIPKLLKPILNDEADMVLGSRFSGEIEDMSIRKQMGNQIFSGLTSVLIGKHITDAQTGFRAMRRELLEKIKPSGKYTYTQEMIIRSSKEGWRIKEVPIYFGRRKYGDSRLISNILSYARNALSIMLRTFYEYHPLKADRKILAIILLLALILRIGFLPIKYGIRSDTAEFIVAGQNFIAGNGYLSITGRLDTAFPPLYPIMIGIGGLILDPILAGRLISILFGTLLIIPIYLLGRKLYGRNVGLMAALFVAFYFSLIYGSVTALTEMTFTAITVYGIFLGLKALEDKRLRYYFFAGVIIALSYLTRTEGFGYLVILGLFTVIYLKGKALKPLLVLLVGFFLVASPYILYVYEESGEFINNKNAFFILGIEQHFAGEPATGYNISQGADTVLDTYQGKIGRDTALLPYIMNNPNKVAYSWMQNEWHILANRIPHKFPVWLIAIAGGGLFVAVWKKKHAYMAVVILYPIISYGFYVTSARSAMLTIALLIIYLGAGTRAMGKFMKKEKLAALLVLLSIMPFLALPATWENLEGDKELIELGQYIKETTPEDAKIMTNNAEIGYYADRTVVLKPYANGSELRDYMDYWNVSL